MGKIHLLDCTLRDGGYVNDWNFGEIAIRGIVSSLEKSGIEMIEVGFLKGDLYDKNRSLFPDMQSVKNILRTKQARIKYVGMLDMSSPIPTERLGNCDGTALDGIRVIFKKNKIEEAYEYCRKIKTLGYMLFVNFVSTDQYTKEEFITSIQKFSKLNPDGVTIVDTFGLLKRKQFLEYVNIANSVLESNIMLCYHAHNNLQQAYGNAEAFVCLNLKRDIVIDTCVFGMGRGAGNLNLEIFADFLNEGYGKNYQIAPILDIMDLYLDKIYKTQYWGYSLPLYLSACLGCHPNYAIYLAEKNTLSQKAFGEILKSIRQEDKLVFDKKCAENYYKEYMENYVDDKETLNILSKTFKGRKVLLLAPGKSLKIHKDRIDNFIRWNNPIVLSVNFCASFYGAKYVFCSNMRRLAKLDISDNIKVIATSNIKSAVGKVDYIVNFSSYRATQEEIIDNAGIMSIRLLVGLGVKEINIAGMDGFSDGEYGSNYFDEKFDLTYKDNNDEKNNFMAKEIADIARLVDVRFITPSIYENSKHNI